MFITFTEFERAWHQAAAPRYGAVDPIVTPSRTRKGPCGHLRVHIGIT